MTNVVRSRSTRTQTVVFLTRSANEIRRALWFKPALAVLVGLVIGTVVGKVRTSGPGFLGPIAFHGNANDARQVMTVIIGALIPVTSLVFALTVVTLQIASTQFSPRLLRTFLRDVGTQVVLGCFVGTIAFCLAVLYEINTDATANGVPRVAVTCALTLAVVCIAMLVYYFGHITNAVRIDSIMRQVEQDTRTLLRRHHPVLVEGSGAVGHDPDADLRPQPPAQAYGLVASTDGYLQGVDERLAELAVRKGLTIEVVPTVGYYVVAGQQLAVVWSDDGSPLKPTTADAILHLIEVAPERRIERDLGLGLRQLVDIINRAMSTGQNDPYTGTQAVHHLTSLMLDCSRRDLSTRIWSDGSGRVRVALPVMTFPTHLRVVCAHIRQGGLERHPRVVHEVLRMLAIVGEGTPAPSRVAATQREVQVLLGAAEEMIHTPADLEEVRVAGADVDARLAARLTVLTEPADAGVGGLS